MTSFLYIIVLYATCLGMVLFYRQLKSFKWRIPYVTLTLSVIIAIIFEIQQCYPILLPVLERNETHFTSGAFWTVVTALFVQDGGVGGALFNCICLLFVGCIAEQYWKRLQVLLLFLIGGVLSEFFAFLWQPDGGGNSIANFAIAGSLLYLCFTQSNLLIRRVGLVGILGVVVLLAMNDIHGSACAIGIFLGYLLQRKKKLVKH